MKIQIHFDFKGHDYLSIIRLKERNNCKEYHITILNWELERLLYGNQVIRELNGSLQADILPDKEDQTELKISIASKLANFLKIPCFVGKQCLETTNTNESVGWEHFHPISKHVHLQA